MKRIALVTGILSVLVLTAGAADAVPAFARKYETSCQTCHVAYPKLNAFGDAFRLRGYRMPGQEENPEIVKEEPVSLGAPAWKEMWPKAIWPSDVARAVPLAGRINFPMRWESTHDGESTVANFQFPETFDILSAGTFGEHLSFFAKMRLIRTEETELLATGEIRRHEDVDVEVEHAEIHFNDLFGSEGAFNLKVGSFEPEMVGTAFSHIRPLTQRNYVNLLSYSPIAPGGGGSDLSGASHHGGGAGISMPATVEGFEAYGVLNHRFLWNVGLVNGIGPGFGSRDGNGLKDVYAKVLYKFGGMGLDGTTADGFASMDNTEPWREKSLKMGLFAYFGNGEDVIFTVPRHVGHDDGGGDDHGGDDHGGDDGMGDHGGDGMGDDHGGDDGMGDDHGGDDHGGDDHGGDDVEPAFQPMEDESFERYGIDLNLTYRDLNLFAVFVRGSDDLRTYDAHMWADHPGMLMLEHAETFDYEAFIVEADYVFLPWLHGVLRYEFLDPANEAAADFEWATFNLTTLIRANVKSYVEIQRDLKEGDNTTFVAGLDFAF